MAINIEIYTKNMELTDRINQYVHKKVSKLERFLTDIEELRVDLSFSKSARNAADRNAAQITIRGRGYILRTEERAEDIYTALDASLEKIQSQIERYKGKHQRGRGDGTPASEVVPQEEETEGESGPIIARRKQFTLVPMDELEALEQMALLGHENFFIFWNTTTSSVNVLYRRRDGTFGLIDPTLG
jgi:putative sigma-54 modulation protein